MLCEMRSEFTTLSSAVAPQHRFLRFQLWSDVFYCDFLSPIPVHISHVIYAAKDMMSKWYFWLVPPSLKASEATVRCHSLWLQWMMFGQIYHKTDVFLSSNILYLSAVYVCLSFAIILWDVCMRCGVWFWGSDFNKKRMIFIDWFVCLKKTD